jgi:KDO2-lipid IV(A) lauroyltransferase
VTRHKAPRWHPRGLNNGLIFGLTHRGVATLPTWMTYSMGHVGSTLAYRFQSSGRRALVDNFGGIFPGKSDAELEALALRTYRSYARDVVDFMRSLSRPPDELLRNVARVDREALDEAMAEGRGAISVSAHFGNWELGGLLLRRITNYPLAVIVMREPDDEVHRRRFDMRASIGIETIEVREQLDTALRVRARLQQNHVIGFLIDRYLGKDYVPVTFFGRPAYFLRTPALLAHFADAPLLPTFVYRDDDGRPAVETGPIVRVAKTGSRDERVQQATQAVAAVIESHIRARPHCWYQFYPFWAAQARVGQDSAPSGH